MSELELDAKAVFDAVAKAGGLEKAVYEDPFDKEFARLRVYHQLLTATRLVLREEAKLTGYGSMFRDICFGARKRVQEARWGLLRKNTELKGQYLDPGTGRYISNVDSRPIKAQIENNKLLICALDDCLEWSATTKEERPPEAGSEEQPG